MIHIKRFYESTSTIEDEIEKIVKECFYEFRIEYGMEFRFQYGRFFQKYNFISNNEMETIFNDRLDIFNSLPYKKSIKVTMVNDGIDTDHSRLEIYTDENSNKEFKIAIDTLNSSLQDIADVELRGIPDEIKPTFYSISFIINYE